MLQDGTADKARLRRVRPASLTKDSIMTMVERGRVPNSPAFAGYARRPNRRPASEASPTERELSPGRVKHLTEKIEAGLAVSFHWASAQLEDVGKTLRMNGNHSSTPFSA